jgi:hypothetical protein
VSSGINQDILYLGSTRGRANAEVYASVRSLVRSSGTDGHGDSIGL